MSAPYRYALALTEDQAVAVEIACETLARIGMGQLDGVADYTPAAKTVDGLLAVREALRAAEPVATRNTYPGIASERVNVTSQRAWEIYTVVRAVLSRDHKPRCICVAHDPFMSLTGERPPRCEVIE